MVPYAGGASAAALWAGSGADSASWCRGHCGRWAAGGGARRGKEMVWSKAKDVSACWVVLKK